MNRNELDKIPFKKIKLEHMMSYIETEHPQDKEWFKEKAIVNDKYAHLIAVRAFCEKYCPEKLPVADPKVNAKEKLKNW